MSLKGNYSVTKANLLIDARQRNPLGLQEWRIVLAMISKIDINDKEFTTQRMTVREFGNLLGYKEPDYKKVQAACKSLIEKNIEIRTKTGWLLTTWISSVQYFDAEGMMEFDFSPKLKPYLLDMQETFTTYKLGHVLLLRSVYGIKLFELGKKWENMKTFKYEVDELKKILGADSEVQDGKADKQPYKQYADFKRRCIAPAIKEINEKTDITLEFNEIKKGRKVVALEFKSRSKEQKKKPQKQLPQPKKEKPVHPMFGGPKKIIREEPVPEWFDKHKEETEERDARAALPRRTERDPMDEFMDDIGEGE